jgi:hypothetical protein
MQHVLVNTILTMRHGIFFCDAHQECKTARLYRYHHDGIANALGVLVLHTRFIVYKLKKVNSM